MDRTFCYARGKLSYRSAADAATAKRGTGHADLNIFLCNYCAAWHLGRLYRPEARPRRQKAFNWRLEIDSLEF